MEPELIKALKALSDITRLRIVNLLQYGDLCVCELETLLDITQSNASRHLLKLGNAGMVKYYKHAKYVYYAINGHLMDHYPFLTGLLNMLKDEPAKLPECVDDLQRLNSYKGQGYTCEDIKQGKVCF